MAKALCDVECGISDLPNGVDICYKVEQVSARDKHTSMGSLITVRKLWES